MSTAKQKPAEAARPLDPPEIPHDDDTERDVLGSCLASHEFAEVACERLTGQEFYRPGHAAIFHVLRTQVAEGNAPDVWSVCQPLEADLDLLALTAEHGGPRVYLASLTERNVLNRDGLVLRCDKLQKLHACRQTIRLLREADQKARDPTVEAADLAEKVREAAELLETGAGRLDRFRTAALAVPDFAAHPFPQPPSLIGDGVLRAGGFGILYGKPGVGKTWHAFALAFSVARGEPWLGLPTKPEGSRVGFLELELPAHTMQERLAVVRGTGERSEDTRLELVVRPTLRGVVDLQSAEDRLGLKHWIRRSRLDLLVLDALSRAHTADENDAQEFGRVLADLDALRHDTGCAILLIHHERKGRNGEEPDKHLDALRGTSRLQSDPTLLVRLWESRGLRCLVFPKVTEGREPDPIWYRMAESGLPEVVDAPEAVASGNAARVLQVVEDAQGLISRAEVQKRAGLSRDTTAKHLKALEEANKVRKVGENKATAYCVPAYLPNVPNLDLSAGET